MLALGADPFFLGLLASSSRCRPRFGLTRLVVRFGRKSLVIVSIGAAVAAPLEVWGIVWADAALLLGAVGVMVRSKAGDVTHDGAAAQVATAPAARAATWRRWR